MESKVKLSDHVARTRPDPMTWRVVLKTIKDHPASTVPELAVMLDVSESSLYNLMYRMKRAGRLKVVSRWEIVEMR